MIIKVMSKARQLADRRIKEATGPIRESQRTSGMTDTERLREKQIKDLEAGGAASLLGEDTDEKKRLRMLTKTNEDRKLRREKLDAANEKINSLEKEKGSASRTGADNIMRYYESGMDVKSLSQEYTRMTGKKVEGQDDILQAMIERQKLASEDKKATKSEDDVVLLQDAKEKARKNTEDIANKLSTDDARKTTAEKAWSEAVNHFGGEENITKEKYRKYFENYLRKQNVADGDMGKFDLEKDLGHARIEQRRVEGLKLGLDSTKKTAPVEKGGQAPSISNIPSSPIEQAESMYKNAANFVRKLLPNKEAKNEKKVNPTPSTDKLDYI